MTERGTPAAAPEWAAPATRRTATGAARGESLRPLLDATAMVAAAASAGEVCLAAVDGAVALTGARAAALGLREGDVVRLVASVGYDCDSMAAGSVLPLDSGLPVTECVRTGSAVSRGGAGSPAWVAVPVVTPDVEGALLVSLPTRTEVDVDALAALGRVAGDALRRCAPAEPPAATVAGPDWLRLAALHAPLDRRTGAGGDVLAWLPGRDAGDGWLLVADTCGSGAEAEPTAAALRRAVTTLAAADLDAAGMLAAVDVALRRDRDADRFVTVLVMRLCRAAGGRVQVEVASAGHPRPLLWRDGQVVEIPCGDGLPLNLLPGGSWVGHRLELAPGDLLLAYTDGLVERPAGDHGDRLVGLLRQSGARADPAAVLDAVVEGLRATAGSPRDDVAVAVVAPAPAV